MPEIGIADKITLDQVKALIGTANPDSGDLTTVFKGLKLLADYVDELETRLTSTRAEYLDYLNNLNTRLTDTRAEKLDLVGTTGDAAGTGSIFARLAQIAGYTDTVETALGQTGDAASSTGSANAKLAWLIANQVISRSLIRGEFSTSQDTLQTALDISGKGTLIIINLYNSGSGSISARSAELKLTLDGNVVASGTNHSSVNAGTYFKITNTLNFPIDYTPLMFDFKSTCLLQIKSDGTNTVRTTWVYNQ